MRLVVEYMPNLSQEAIEEIRQTQDASMSSEEKSQYCIEDVLANISSRNCFIPMDDELKLKNLRSEGVDYIEI